MKIKYLVVLLCVCLNCTDHTNKDYLINPVPSKMVSVDDRFWAPRLAINRTVTVPYNFQKCEETGRIDNFAKAGGLMEGEFFGNPYDDSDVYKVIEGASYVLAMHPDPELDTYLDSLIMKIAAAQEDDGYLYTARTLNSNHKRIGRDRWLNERGAQTSGQDSHELYNVGHLYEAAVAHYQATGKRTLLKVALKNADLVAQVWGPGRLSIPSGHQEIEIGLVKLYRATGNSKYLDLAKFLLECRGRCHHQNPNNPLELIYYSDHMPVTEQLEAVGHSVRSTYMYAAMTDIAAITGDSAYRRAVQALWESVVCRKMYVTGGIGARHGIEGFGDDYELPEDAYNETCAAIGFALWNYRMFLLFGDTRYLDIFERIIYNGFLASTALSGERFFYPNPLLCDGKTSFNRGALTRQPWFRTSCCPVNIVRFLPSIPGCVYGTAADTIYINLFMGGDANIPLAGKKVAIRQKTDYPWDGRIQIELRPEIPHVFTVKIRVPGWAYNQAVPCDLYHYKDESQTDLKFTINGREVKPELQKGFAVLRRAWNKEDVIELLLPLKPRRIYANKLVTHLDHCVAIENGPLVYCAEGIDNSGQALKLALSDTAPLRVVYQSDLFHGVNLIQTLGVVSPHQTDHRSVAVEKTITLIPYYLWNNRGPGEMRVWLPRIK